MAHASAYATEIHIVLHALHFQILKLKSWRRYRRTIRAIRIHFTGFRLWHNISAPLLVPHLLRVVTGEASRRFRATRAESTLDPPVIKVRRGRHYP